MTGFLLRWGVAFVLLAATFNPTKWNYIRWVEANYNEQLPLVVLFGLLLFVGYIIYLRATLRSIGGFGMFLVLAIVGALVWVLWDMELLSLTQTSDMVWLGLIALSLVLGIGLSWSHVRRWLSGQSDVDDIDEQAGEYGEGSIGLGWRRLLCVASPSSRVAGRGGIA